jgi:uncharacterized protein DUF6263
MEWYRLRFLGVVLVLLAASPSQPLRAGTNFNDLLDGTWCRPRRSLLHQVVTTETSRAMRAGRQAISIQERTTFHYTWRLLCCDDREWVFQQRIESLRLENLHVCGTILTYDSAETSANPNGLVSEVCGALAGAEFTVTLTPDLRVLKIEGREVLLRKLVRVEERALLDEVMSDVMLRSRIEQSLPVLPKPPKRAGEAWTRESSLEMGPIGRYPVRNAYSIAGRAGKIAKVRVEPSIDKAKNAELKSGESAGMISLDTREDRVERSELTVQFKGKFTVVIGGDKTEVELDQMQRTTFKTMNENPPKR